MNPYMGGAAGGGVGGLLGQLLGAPRRGVVSAYKYLNPDDPAMTEPVFSPGDPMSQGGPGYGAQSGYDQFNMNRPQYFNEMMGLPEGTMVPSQQQAAGGGILPMLLGGLGAGAAAFMGGGALAPMAFAAGSGIGQMVNEGLGAVTPYDVQDVTGDLGMGGNLAASMAADPLSYVGAMGGARAGQVAPRRASAAQRLDDFTTPQALVGRNTTMGGAGTIANRPMLGTPAPVAQEMGGMAAAGGPNLGGYNPEQLAAMFGSPVDLETMGAAATYKNVNPQVSALLEELGMAVPGGKGMQFPGGLPNWAGYRGSSVMPTRGMEGAIPHMQDLAGMTGYTPQSFGRMQTRLESLFPDGLPPRVPQVGPTQATPELQRLYSIRERLRQMQGGGY